MHSRIAMTVLTPYQATAAPGTPMRALGAVGVCDDKAKLATALTQCLLSNVRDVIGNFKKDVETMGRSR